VRIVSGVIHPKAKFFGDVQVGEGSFVSAGCYLYGPIKIGKNTTIHSGTIIGTPPEHKRKESKYGVVIGDDNVIGANCTITASTDERPTTIGNGNYLMSGVHISHDCLIGDDNVIAHKVVLAGHCVVGDRANLGVGALLHQHTTIGSGSMIGMGSVVNKDIYPYLKVWGNPVRYGGFNFHQLKGLRFDGEDIENEEDFRDSIVPVELIKNDLVQFHRFAGKRGKERIVSYRWIEHSHELE
jgi:UDP-N-acetylglucosamine acyltransferase